MLLCSWILGWHLCSNCEKNAYYMCYTCTFSLCKACIKDSVILCVRGNKGFCETCMKMVTLIEHNLQGNKDMVCVFLLFCFLVFFFFFFDSMFVLLVQWVILIVKTELCSCSLVYKWGNIWNRSIFGLGIYPYLWFNSWSLFIFSFPLINWDLASIVLLSFKIDCFKMR